MDISRTLLKTSVVIIAAACWVGGCTEENTVVAPPVDHLAPRVEWNAPESGAELAGTVELTFTAYDEGGISRLNIYRNGFSPPDWSIPASQDTLYTVSWDTREVDDDVYILEARAWDETGNIGISPSLVVRIKNNPDPPPEDHTPPVVVWRSPEPGSEVEGTVELRFDALDDDAVDSVKVYINGPSSIVFNIHGHPEVGYSLLWATVNFEDGTYYIDVRAWDPGGNIGLSDPISLTVQNNRPRVTWVPDDFGTIQDAINASQDGDTVRVRPGIYREGLRLMGKNIWLESERGPEITRINARGWNDGISIADREDYTRTTVRGFTIYSEYQGIRIYEFSGVTIYNCIFINILGVNEFNGVWFAGGRGYIYNCVFDRCYDGIVGGYSVGEFKSSIFIRCYATGYFHFARWENWITYGWNLFWDNERDYSPIDIPHFGDVFADPLFIEDSYVLSNNSPAIDAGDPEIYDLDGSRSDIGVHGGPYAYITN